MPTITTQDGVEIFYKTGEKGNRSCSAMDGRYHPTTGTRRCYFSFVMGTASSPMIDVAMVALPK